MKSSRSTDRAGYDIDYDHIVANYGWCKRELDGRTHLFAPDEGNLMGMDDATAHDLGDWDEDGAVYAWALYHAPEAIQLTGERIKRNFETLEDFLADTDERSVDTRTDWSHIIFEDDGVMYSKVPGEDGGMIAVELSNDYTVRKTL